MRYHQSAIYTAPTKGPEDKPKKHPLQLLEMHHQPLPAAQGELVGYIPAAQFNTASRCLPWLQ